MIETRLLTLALSTVPIFLSGAGAAARQEGEALSAQHEVGHALDREGSAIRRGPLEERWRLIEAGDALAPGDWLEVATRGANALRLRLANRAELVLGPGTLVELISPARLNLLRGELLVDPRGSAGEVEVLGPRGASIRVRERAALCVGDEALTRLDADPRWLMGYLSDASTEALGSLLANVDGRNVPLTIGYHKVTVDVRDQVARTVIEESFENHTHTVLEGVFYFPLPADASISGFGMWIGNELVQGEIVEKERAREIYESILRERRDPGLLEWTGGNIFKARVFPIASEKRIRIAYTQMLAKTGNEYAYHYALQSELLRKTPLRRLEIAVHVHSAQPLKAVECPSHSARIRTSAHAASVEFSAEEFAPERDFELRMELEPREERLTLVPHRRGDDGYFMLLIDAPEIGEAFDGAPPSPPLELLVLADTSGSTWGAPRANQVAFIEALLGALGPNDAFDLATVDVETRWAFDRPRVGDFAARQEALAFLEARDALGWSDLERAFREACQRAGPHTQVVYVGDGVPTAGAADGVAMAHELARLYTGQGTFHAVVPGPSSEMPVLRALAGLGGGSVRAIGGGTDPAQTAFALLAELTAPAIKDLRVSFEGLAVAAVYPETLPNLPSGGQQVIVGRFDPLGGERNGRVRISGHIDGAPVRFESEVHPATEDEGNSFIPRLWARHHLDHLLDQGRSDEIREQIIAVSEDYQIATPYTSFLVLESDADRERFGVRKGFRMRDGEEYFTEGREGARHELVREQMLRAKSWRRQLREELIKTLSGMGRELVALLRESPVHYDRLAALGGLAGSLDGSFEGGARRPRRQRGEKDRNELDFTDSREGSEILEETEPEEELLDSEDADAFTLDSPAEAPALSLRFAAKSAQRAQRSDLRAGFSSPSSLGLPFGGNRGNYSQYDPLEALFPGIGGARADDPEWSWPQDVLEALARLDRRALLGASPLGWRIEVEATWTDARGREQTTRGQTLTGPGGWASVTPHAEGQLYVLEWLAGERRGVLREGWRLGRTRAAEDADASAWSAPFAWHFGDHLRHYAAYEARLESIDVDRARVVFSLPGASDNSLALELDLARGLLLEEVWSVAGVRTRGTLYGEFRQVGGLWWPGSIQSWSKEGQGSTLSHVSVEALEAPGFAHAMARELARRDDAILLAEDGVVQVAAAKQSVRDERAGLEEHWRLLRHFAATQRWERARAHLEALPERPGRDGIRLVFLRESRERELLRLELTRLAAALAATVGDADYGLALDMLSYTAYLNGGNETLAILDTLRPVFARQEGLLDPELEWERQRLAALANLDRPETTIEARRLAALRWPYAFEMQSGYALELARRGDVDAAVAWLERSEAEDGPWMPHERTYFRQKHVEILWNGYRLEELVARCEAWEAEEPALLDNGLNDRHLSALIYLDREREAWERIENGLAFAAKSPREPFEQACLHAAVQHALGQGWELYHQRYEDGRAQLLARTARTLAQDDSETYLAGWIVQHWVFRQTDAGRALLAELYAEVDAQVAYMPVARLVKWIQWLRAAGFLPAAGEPAWQALFERILVRRLATEPEPERLSLAQIVLGYGELDLRLRLLRGMLAEAEGEGPRALAAEQLAAALLEGPWSPERAREYLALLPTLVLPADADPVLEGNRDRAALAISDLVDWTLERRSEAIVAALPDFESLTRRQLAAESATARRAVRAEAAGVVAELERTLEPEFLASWAAIERVFLLVENGSELPYAWSRSLELLQGSVAELSAAEDTEDVPFRVRLLAERALRTCAWLLVETSADELEERVAALRAQLEKLAAIDSPLPDGRAAQRDLWILLDRGDELEAALAEWFGSGGELEKTRWGHDYAHVLAERGRLAEAAETLEEIDRIDELAFEDLRALSTWYTALDRREPARRALERSFEVLGENRLADELYRRLTPYQRHGEDVPPELDPEIPLRFVALFNKAPDPHQRLWVLQNYYEATKDYRLLECLPEAVIGHSAQGIYPFLTQVAGLVGLIDEEASADRIEAHLAELAERTETQVDRRGLRMLQFQVLLRAARQAHGTERHAERSLAALRAAFRGDWIDGEILLMAQFLASHGRLEPRPLAEEQLRQLRELAGRARDADERLAVAGYLAQALWHHGRQEDAVQALEAAIVERRAAADGRLPQGANPQLVTLSGWLASLGRFRGAEKIWLEELAAGHPEERVLWLREQLFGLYRDALLARAELSLGRGDTLYGAVLAALQRDLAERTNERHAGAVVGVLTDLWTRAHHDLLLARAREDATGFAFGVLPEVLALYQYRGGQQMVSSMGECLYKITTPLTTLEFAVTRAENEPAWLRLRNEDFWSQHAWYFGRSLLECRGLEAALRARALRIVLAELGEDLRTRQQRNRVVYDQRYNHFWGAERAEFLEATLALLEEWRDNAASSAHGAEYLYHGLGAADEAIATLSGAWRRGILHLEGRDQLATYLQEQGRWKESLAVAQELVAERPAQARYHVMTMLARFHTDDGAALVRALETAEAWLRGNGAWHEPAIATLAEGCLQTRLLEDCARLYGEAIALHVRGAPRRGVGDGVLCLYYRNISQAHAGRGRIREAVDAAAGAIVSWGSDIGSRGYELSNLRQVLASAENLEAYVAELDAEVQASGMENPIVRKALGQIYLEREEPERAAAQLRLALAARANDAETNALLVQAYERQERPDLVAAALLAQARVAGHDWRLWTELGRCLAKARIPEQAERAFTTLVELSPNESEGHAALAAVRESQQRWDEAAERWRHVARIRTKEPTGWMGLARSLARAGRTDEARAVVEHLTTESWPTRFGDVRREAASLLP